MCKACAIFKARAHYRDNIERMRAVNRAYSKTPRGKAVHNAATLRYFNTHPGRRSAILKVWRAVKRGTLIRKPCAVCGSKQVQAHHADYNKPLDVVWLCALHHREEHH